MFLWKRCLCSGPIVLAFLVFASCDTLPAQASSQDLPTLDAATLNRLPTYLSLALNYMRLNPTSLSDKTTLLYFIHANNCGNPQIDRLLANEFESPRITEFYKSKAAQILAPLALPMIEWESTLSMGQYDTSGGAFQVPQPLSYHDVSIDIGGPCPGHGGFYDSANRFFSSRDRRLTFEATFEATADVEIKPFEISKVPMAQDAAHEYVNSLSSPTNRYVTVVAKIEVLPTPPRYEAPIAMPGVGFSKPSAHFMGRVVSLAGYDKYPDGRVLVTFDPYNLPKPRAK